MTRTDRTQGHDAYRDGGRLRARITFHERFGRDVPDIHRIAWDHVASPSEAEVLEVGVGTGRHWRVNAERVPAGWRPTLTDRSPGMLEEAQRSLAPVVPTARFAVADATVLPFDDDTFDLAFAHHMLYHVEEPVRAAAELRRVLRPGGVLYALTNGEAHLAEVHALAACVASAWPQVRIDVPEALTFTLENGSDVLGTAFTRVERVVFEDVLRIDEAGPLAAYVASLAYSDDATTDAALGAWLDAFAHERLAYGPLVAHRVSALFSAS